jgi:hypothetical protein
MLDPEKESPLVCAMPLGRAAPESALVAVPSAGNNPEILLKSRAYHTIYDHFVSRDWRKSWNPHSGDKVEIHRGT